MVVPCRIAPSTIVREADACKQAMLTEPAPARIPLPGTV
jgi:hypothetical protein